jgi:hypothetical protein
MSKEFHRMIFFTKVPINGYYRYKDEFQFFPAYLEKQPKSKYSKHYPNILEYWTDKEEVIEVPVAFKGLEDLHTLTVKTSRSHDMILTLLSGITNNLFFRYEDMEGNWGIPITDDDEKEKKTPGYSTWCMKLLYWKEMADELKIVSFSELDLPKISKVEHKNFYTYDPNLDFDENKEIVLPESINEILDAYYSLNVDFRIYVDSALSYTKSAVEMWHFKKTLSLLASFTAMESMVNLQYKDEKPEKCNVCGQLMYSISKKFREFLLLYVGDSPNNKKKFNAYYSLRSKIVHTGRQLGTEKLFADVTEDERNEEFLKRIEILQIGKMAIVNWLLLTWRMNKLT